jgi:hypothetical protein
VALHRMKPRDYILSGIALPLRNTWPIIHHRGSRPDLPHAGFPACRRWAAPVAIVVVALPPRICAGADQPSLASSSDPGFEKSQ